MWIWFHAFDDAIRCMRGHIVRQIDASTDAHLDDAIAHDMRAEELALVFVHRLLVIIHARQHASRETSSVHGSTRIEQLPRFLRR